jgi:hypothetical protein
MTTQQQRIRLHEQDTDRQTDRFARLFGVPVPRRSRARTVARSARGQLEVHAYVRGAVGGVLRDFDPRPSSEAVAAPTRWEQARSAQL